jgi:hypothetical protein
MNVGNKFLFNFAASYSSGGYKRLREYAKWFNGNGGAWFIIHPRCRSLSNEFSDNKFFVVRQSRIRRLYDDCGYLESIRAEIGCQPELYFSYGIPLYFRFGRINWFHLSNVLPIEAAGIPLSLADRITFRYLGWRIRRGFRIADVISAESNNSLRLIGGGEPGKLFLSVNGSDDELDCLQNYRVESKENIAAVLGTHRYKALKDSFRVFEMLKRENEPLKLIILGRESWVPNFLKGIRDVEIRGLVERSEVIDCLRKSKIYISTTRVENSYNAASEGIVFADESYISDIGPHRELLTNVPFDRIAVPGVDAPLLHVERKNLSGLNLKSWNTVVLEMLARIS